MALDLSFKDLADVAAGDASDGRPLKIALELIDEDPDQPRREFPEDELQQLAASRAFSSRSWFGGLIRPSATSS